MKPGNQMRSARDLQGDPAAIKLGDSPRLRGEEFFDEFTAAIEADENDEALYGWMTEDMEAEPQER